MQQVPAPQQAQRYGYTLHLEYLVNALPGSINHPVSPVFYMHERVAFPHGAAKTLMLLGEIGFHADQKYGHARQDEQIGQKNGKIINDGSSQWTYHGLGGMRHKPE